MSDASDLRRRLSRLGRTPERPARRSAARPSQALQPGEEVSTPAGSAYRIQNSYPLDHRHGAGSLAEVLEFSPALAGEIAGLQAGSAAPLSDWAFLDLETTGLAGGAGTLGFLVGLGAFVEGQFRLRQYFLRDPAQEAGMLHALQEDLEQARGFVTFNGRAFDLPLLGVALSLGAAAPRPPPPLAEIRPALPPPPTGARR